MNKKKLMVFSMIGIFALAIVGAALSGYISNSVQSDVTVSQPIQQWLKDGVDWTQEPVSFGNIFGGENIIIDGKSQNFASVEIIGETNFIVTNWDGVTCADFEDVTTAVSPDNGVNWIDPVSIGSYCDQGVDNYHVEFDCPVPTVWTPGQIYLTNTVVTFETDAYGTYTFKSSLTPEITP